jgi:hypothetical protein
VDFERVEIQTKVRARSLFWCDDALVDSVAGNVEFRFDGTATHPCVNWAYRFDAAVRSVSGRYVVIYEKLGTKALLTCDGRILRELNRSFYCANAYEFPVAFAVLPDQREVLIHCPDEYNRIEIEDIATGDRLTGSLDRNPADFFHSRLAVSDNGRWLLSAGWIWHPVDAVRCFDLHAAISNPAVLDSTEIPDLGESCEVNSAVFLGEDRLLLASGPDAQDFRDNGHEGLTPGHLAVFNLKANRFENMVAVDGVMGTMMPVGTDYVVSFYDYPKLIDRRSGEIVVAWPDIEAGEQNSSIVRHLNNPVPAIALDPENWRFAVARADRITVIVFRH